MSAFDWNDHRWDDGVLCRVAMRPEYNGAGLKPECLALDGMEFRLRGFWLMDDDDNYPGEWALGPVRGSAPEFDAAEIGWIASGDVIVLAP